MSIADPQCMLRLERPIPGTDHLKIVDPRRLASLRSEIDDVAARLGLDKLEDFYFSSRFGSYKAKWTGADKGLKVVRAVRKYLLNHRVDDPARAGRRADVVEILDGLVKVLNDADTRHICFCFVGNY